MRKKITEHTRQLRAATSKKWKLENVQRLSLQFVPKNHYLIEAFKKIECDNNVNRFKILIDNYIKNNTEIT